MTWNIEKNQHQLQLYGGKPPYACINNEDIKTENFHKKNPLIENKVEESRLKIIFTIPINSKIDSIACDLETIRLQMQK